MKTRQVIVILHCFWSLMNLMVMLFPEGWSSVQNQITQVKQYGNLLF